MRDDLTPFVHFQKCRLRWEEPKPRWALCFLYWIFMKSCFITSPPPGNGYLCMFISKRFSLAKCNVKNGRLAKKPLDPKIRK